MINAAAFDLNTDLSQQAASGSTPGVSRLKQANPNYKDGWYLEYDAYQDTDGHPITTSFSILECYLTQRVDKTGSTLNQTLHVKAELAPVNGLVAPNTFLDLKLWGEGLSVGPNPQTLREGSSNYRQFGQWAIAVLGPQAFSNSLAMTLSNKDKTWSEERVHFPALIGARGILAFAAVDSFRNKTEYAAFFFIPGANGGKPLSPFEFSHGGQYKSPKADYDTYLEILRARYETWLGLAGGAESIPAPNANDYFAASSPAQYPQHAAPEAQEVPWVQGAQGAQGAQRAEDDIPF